MQELIERTTQSTRATHAEAEEKRRPIRRAMNVSSQVDRYKFDRLSKAETLNYENVLARSC